MKKILGLDLGTTSIGWALVNEKENDNEKSEIIRLGVRVNPLTVDGIGILFITSFYLLMKLILF